MNTRAAFNEIQNSTSITGEAKLRALLEAVNVFSETIPNPDGRDSAGRPYWKRDTIRKHCASAKSVRIPVENTYRS